MFLSTKGAQAAMLTVYICRCHHMGLERKKKRKGEKNLVALMIPCTCRKETVCIAGTVPAQKQAQLSKVKQMALDLVPGKH